MFTKVPKPEQELGNIELNKGVWAYVDWKASMGQQKWQHALVDDLVFIAG